MLKMNCNLRNLLETVSLEGKKGKGAKTHATHYDPEAKWLIPNQQLNKFWSTYCQLIADSAENEELGEGLNLSELPQPIMPLIQTFTFKFNLKNQHVDEWDPYPDLFIMWICHLYQHILKKYFVLPNDYALMVVVMETKEAWEETTKNGEKLYCIQLRIQFPNARIDIKLQQDFIAKTFLDLMRDHKVFNLLSVLPIHHLEDLMIKDLSVTPIPMFGSSPSVDYPCMRITHIWMEITMDAIESEELPAELEFSDAFNLKYHDHVRNRLIDKKVFDKYPVEHCLPIYLSVYYGNGILILNPETDLMLNKKVLEEVTLKVTDDHENNLEFAEYFLSILSSNRFVQQSYWEDIGKCLYTVDKGRMNGLEEWIKWTVKATKDLGIIPDYLMSDIRQISTYKYETFSQSNHNTIKTLAFFARQDHYEAYVSWHKQWTLDAMQQAASGTDTMVGMALYRFYWLDFAYDNKNNRWYKFTPSGWVENHDGLQLRKYISSEFMKKFEYVKSKEVAKQTDMDEKAKKDSVVLEKQLTALVVKLQSVTFKNKYMIEAKEWFVNENMSDLFDINLNLTALPNGVLEIVNKDIIFRTAKPEDYLSLCAGVKFNQYHWQHPLVIECEKWLREVYPIPELYHHFMKFNASFLKSGNCDKIFAVYSGGGNNSKSMVVKLINAVFGKYVVKMPPTILCEKAANSGNASPQIAQAKGAKVAFIDEAEDNIPMNKGSIKKYTGGDSFFARKLNENGGAIELTIKLILVVNGIPCVKDKDKAVEDRIKVFPHLSKWVKKDKLAEIEESERHRFFLEDTDFHKRIPILAPAFLWMLTQYYPKYATEGLSPLPECIVNYTKEYWRKSDRIGCFLEESVTAITKDGKPDPKFHLDLVSIYEDFKIWWKQAYPSSFMPSRDILKEDLYNRDGWGKSLKGWYGVALNSRIAGPSDFDAKQFIN